MESTCVCVCVRERGDIKSVRVKGRARECVGVRERRGAERKIQTTHL